MGCSIPVTVDEEAVVVRDIYIEFGKTIECFKATMPNEPFMSFPLDAIQSAASSVCMAILGGIVTRSIEQD